MVDLAIRPDRGCAAQSARATERHRVDVGREFPVRGHQDRRPEVKADWSKILVLSTPDDTRTDVLRCGEVLSAVLLECTTAFMATCTLTHLIELEGEPRPRTQHARRAGIRRC